MILVDLHAVVPAGDDGPDLHAVVPAGDDGPDIHAVVPAGDDGKTHASWRPPPWNRRLLRRFGDGDRFPEPLPDELPALRRELPAHVRGLREDRLHPLERRPPALAVEPPRLDRPGLPR